MSEEIYPNDDPATGPETAAAADAAASQEAAQPAAQGRYARLTSETGGVRKLRWAREGEGKSGGHRVIYYFHSERIPLFVLLIYGKNEKANLTQAEKNDMRRLTALLAAYGRQKP